MNQMGGRNEILIIYSGFFYGGTAAMYAAIVVSA
jgi:hypothetical protein